MTATILEIDSPEGLRRVALDQEFCRVGSDPKSTVIMESGPAHCLTIRKEGRLIKVTNRTDRALKFGRNLVKPDHSMNWKPGSSVRISDNISLKLLQDKPSHAAIKKQKQRNGAGPNTKRQWMFGAAAAGMLCWWLVTSLGNPVDHQSKRRELRNQVLNLLELQQDDSSLIRVLELVQNGGLEEARGNASEASQYFELAKHYAESLRETEREDYRVLFTYLDQS